MKILYIQDNGILAVVNLSEDGEDLESLITRVVPENKHYVIVDNSAVFPEAEFRDAWHVSDEHLTNGVNSNVVIIIDQVKAEQIKRNALPKLSPVEFELRLLKAGLRQQVLDYVAASEELQIVFNRTTYFSRTDPFLLEAMQALNLSNAQVDAMWLGIV